jgi:hypothetical protein
VTYPCSVLSWIEWSRRYEARLNSIPNRGDLFFFDKPGITHIGFVAGVSGSRIATLEGNIFSNGTCGGAETGIVVRNRHECDGFIAIAPRPIANVNETGERLVA